MAVRTSSMIFKVGANSGASVSWKAYADSVSLERVRQELDAKSISVPTDVVMADEEVTIPCGGPLTKAFDDIFGPMFDLPDTAYYVEIGPVGSTTGDPKYTTTGAHVMDYKMSFDAAGIGKWSGTIKIVGGMTRAAY